MNKKRFIMAMVILAVVALLVGMVGKFFEFKYHQSQKKRFAALWQETVGSLESEYQNWLNQTAAQIKQLPMDQLLYSSLTSEIMQKSPGIKLYLWMSTPKGDFIFGIPHSVFAYLNKNFDKYQSVIASDGHWADRNDFLLKLVNRHAEIDFSEFDAGINARDGQPTNERRRELAWRFFKEESGEQDDYEPVRVNLSVPVVDAGKQLLGTLYLKIEDRTIMTQRDDLRRSSTWAQIFFPATDGFLVGGLLFLWFLLPSWVYIDARERNVRNALKWALFVVVSFGVAWMIYLIVRPATLAALHCPQCAKELNGTRSYCPHCGFDLSGSFCPQCQYPIKLEWEFCPSCRHDLAKKSDANESPAAGSDSQI